MATNPSALLTRADLDDLPDDGRRYELVDGRLLVTPMARLRHQRVVGLVYRAVDDWARDHHGLAYPGANVDLTADTHLEPDVVWSSNEDDSGLGFDVTPELVVEVASPSTRRFDRTTKKDRYAATGCRELWIVDLDHDTVEQWVVENGVAGRPLVHGRGTSFTSPLFDGATFAVDDLLGPAA